MRLFILHFISLIQIGCMPLHTHIAKYASLTQPVTQIMKPFSHFRLAEADKKKKEQAFLDKSDTSSDDRPQPAQPERDETTANFHRKTTGKLLHRSDRGPGVPQSKFLKTLDQGD